MAEGASVFDAVIRAVDQASGPIMAIAHKIPLVGHAADALAPHARGMREVFQAAFGGMEHDAEHAGHEMHKVGTAAEHAGHQIEHASHAHGYGILAGHLSVIRGHFGEIGGTLRESGESIGELLPALGALGAAASVAGVFEMLEHSTEAFSEMSKQAAGVGMAVAAFQNLSTVAKMADIPIESMSTALFKLNVNMQNASTGKNKEAAAYFRQMGISLHDAHGHARSAADIMPLLAEAFAHNTNETQKSAAAMALFGRGGKDILPLLVKGREELEELSKESEKLNFTPDKEQQEGLEKYHRSMVGLTVAANGFMLEISSKLAPVLEPVVRLATDWMLANRDWISSGIADHVGDLARWVEHLDLKKVVDKTMEWGRAAFDLVNDFGGVRVLLEGIIAVKAVGWAAPFVRGLWDISLAVRGVIAGLEALEATAGVTAFKAILGRVFPEAVGLALPYVAGAAAAAYVMQPSATQSSEFERAELEQYRREHGLPTGPRVTMPSSVPTGPTVQAPALRAPQMAPLNPWAPDYETPAQRLERERLGLPPTTADMPQIYSRQHYTGDTREGRVKTEITIRGLPPGSTVRGSASGIADTPDVDVGYAGLVGAY